MDRCKVEILGISTSAAGGGAYALILKEVEGKRQLPIIIGAFEAQAIALEIEGIKPPRPMTHDLLKSVIDSFGSSLLEVTITELRDGTFYAKLALDSEDTAEIDSRPSDAIALAVRYSVPIFVAEEVLAEAGIVPESGGEPSRDAPDEQSGEGEVRLLDVLQSSLQDAIQREDYEEAARLRDEIRRHQNSG